VSFIPVSQIYPIIKSSIMIMFILCVHIITFNGLSYFNLAMNETGYLVLGRRLQRPERAIQHFGPLAGPLCTSRHREGSEDC
jgi:hypothetical protein